MVQVPRRVLEMGAHEPVEHLSCSLEIVPLSSVGDDLIELGEQTYRAYRTALGVDGAGLPSDFGDVVDVVTTFADPLVRSTAELR